MKKITMIAAVAVLALSFASCKKDRTCTCTTTGTGYTSTSTTTIYEVKKGDAMERCVGDQTTTVTAASGVSTTSTGDKTTCELK